MKHFRPIDVSSETGRACWSSPGDRAPSVREPGAGMPRSATADTSTRCGVPSFARRPPCGEPEDRSPLDARLTSSTAIILARYPIPEPPYSGGVTRPSSPRSPICRIRASGNSSVSSICARGEITCSANSRHRAPDQLSLGRSKSMRGLRSDHGYDPQERPVSRETWETNWFLGWPPCIRHRAGRFKIVEAPTARCGSSAISAHEETNPEWTRLERRARRFPRLVRSGGGRRYPRFDQRRRTTVAEAGAPAPSIMHQSTPAITSLPSSSLPSRRAGLLVVGRIVGPQTAQRRSAGRLGTIRECSEDASTP
jgi:hypothetical protein